MSDHYVIFIPVDPRFIPDTSRQQRAVEYLRTIAPRPDEITSVVHDGIRFVHAGGNFERILCPACSAELQDRDNWWTECLNKDVDDSGFQLNVYQTPCCEARVRLNDLIYEWPMGFAMCEIQTLNAGLGKVSPKIQQELEAILATKLLVVYQRI